MRTGVLRWVWGALLAMSTLCVGAQPVALAAKACSVCHGAAGVATNHGYFPRIAGKPQGYLYHQLLNFRDGRRHYAAMSQLLQVLGDDYLMEIAGYFASQELPYPPPQTTGAAPEVLALGEQLVRRGDPMRQIPACVSCHGATMTGVQPFVPGLLGLPRDYLNAQMGAFQTGQRKGLAPDCMAKVVRQLTPADVTAISTWLSSQALPADTRPARSLPTAMPMPCGSAAR